MKPTDPSTATETAAVTTAAEPYGADAERTRRFKDHLAAKTAKTADTATDEDDETP